MVGFGIQGFDSQRVWAARLCIVDCRIQVLWFEFAGFVLGSSKFVFWV